MLFAYILEGNTDFGPQSRLAYEAFVRRGDTICTSVFTLGEVLAGPKRVKNQMVYDSIRSFMREGEVQLLPFTAETAENYSSIRALTRLKAADAIHAATALDSRVDFFITNDFEIQKQTTTNFESWLFLGSSSLLTSMGR
jgi:predicted nucleic acid-binding protein